MNAGVQQKLPARLLDLRPAKVNVNVRHMAPKQCRVPQRTAAEEEFGCVDWYLYPEQAKPRTAH